MTDPGFDPACPLTCCDDRGAWMAETVETLKAMAVEATGLRAFGGDWFEQPLAAWVEDLAGPSLSESGRALLAPPGSRQSFTTPRSGRLVQSASGDRRRRNPANPLH